MEVRHLELMRELAQRGTLAAVAAATYRTPSALSQQLRTAERELGVALVEPSARGLRLTWAGQVLAHGADDVLAALESVQATLDAGRGEPRGIVQIGTLPSAGAALLPQLFATLAGGPLTVTVEDYDLAEADFATRTLDADIVIGHSLVSDKPAGSKGLRTVVLTREPLDVAVPADHPLAPQSFLNAAQVAIEPWIVVPQGYPFATVHERIEAVSGIRLQSLAQVKDNRLVESMVSQGLGLGLLPRFSTPASPHYRLIPLSDVPSVRSIVAMGRPDRFARFAVHAVLNHLVAIGERLMNSTPAHPSQGLE